MKKRYFLLIIAMIFPIIGFSKPIEEMSCGVGGITMDINKKNELFIARKNIPIEFKLGPGATESIFVPIENYGKMEIKVERKLTGPSRVSVYFTGQGVKDFLWSSKDFKMDVSKYYGVALHWEQKEVPSPVNFLYDLTLNCVTKAKRF